MTPARSIRQAKLVLVDMDGCLIAGAEALGIPTYLIGSTEGAIATNLLELLTD